MRLSLSCRCYTLPLNSYVSRSHRGTTDKGGEEGGEGGGMEGWGTIGLFAIVQLTKRYSWRSTNGAGTIKFVICCESDINQYQYCTDIPFVNGSSCFYEKIRSS